MLPSKDVQIWLPSFPLVNWNGTLAANTVQVFMTRLDTVDVLRAGYGAYIRDPGFCDPRYCITWMVQVYQDADPVNPLARPAPGALEFLGTMIDHTTGSDLVGSEGLIGRAVIPGPRVNFATVDAGGSPLDSQVANHVGRLICDAQLLTVQYRNGPVAITAADKLRVNVTLRPLV